MQRQNQAVDLKGNLAGVGLLAELTLGLRQLDGAAQGGLPGGHRRGQRVAHRAAAVVKFNRAADVDAARIDLGRGLHHPVVKEGLQAGQATAFFHGRVKNTGLKAVVVLADDGNLQFFARTKVGEHARLAHARDFGHGANGQALQADLRGQAQGRVDDGRLGLLAFDEHAPTRLGGRQAFNVVGGLAVGHGLQKRTIGLFCTKTTLQNKEPGRSRVNRDLPGDWAALRP